MKKNSVTEFELEKEEFKIKLKRGNAGAAPVVFEDPQAVNYAAQPLLAASAPAAPALTVASSSEQEIKSPMIGTFYRAPSPESASYVEVGTEVNPDTVVCIIEAMKVMNEIKAECRGVITQILLESAKPVEFGQPMFKIRPS